VQAANGRTRALMRFGLLELAPDTGELRKGGRPVRLQPQPARVLAVLAGRAGELVTREELHREVWGEGTHVDLDQGINFCIRQIRAALGDSAEAPVYIETVPRRGYRFLAPVEDASPAPGGPPPSPPPVPARRRLPRSAVSAVLLLLALALTLFAAARAGRPPSKSPEGRAMLAVLPFEDLSGEPGAEHWSDGLTEELISQLGRIDPGRLGVIARTSSMRYKGTREPVDRIGRELGVDYILEGSVRRSGERWRITAQLIEVRDQTHLWAESYDREAADVLAVQREVSERVARALALELLPGRAAAAPPVPPAAREAFLKGRYLLNKRDRTAAETEKSVSLFEQAVAAAPSHAAAWAGLADALAALPRPPRQIVPRARAAALRALEIDPGLAVAHYRLAGIHLYYDWDWEAARREYERALELDPGYATAHHSFAAYFSILGRHDEALAGWSARGSSIRCP
ncbi:MAG TPA: winged helix-turn-helix domain-containing protein, partial [Thermoanaerobaculia bacterium]|nr:winged helix-turn-helix domain-containing protein [Thermoanaerobaculia bacterium]